MRKAAMAVAVTQGPDAGHVRLQLIVNDNVAALVTPDTSQVEAQVAGVGGTSHREKHIGAYYFRRSLVATDANGNAAVALLKGYAFRIRPNLYSLILQNFAH